MISLLLSTIGQGVTLLRNKMSNGDLMAELLVITAELGGQMERSECADSSGRYWKKIVITYDVHEKKK